LQGHLVCGSRVVAMERRTSKAVGIKKALKMPPSKLSTLVRPRKRSRLVIYIFPGLGKPICDTSYKTVRNTTHSEHKQEESPQRHIRNQAAHPRDHTCKPCHRYIPSCHIPCARIRRLLARWCLGPVTCTCNHGKI